MNTEDLPQIANYTLSSTAIPCNSWNIDYVPMNLVYDYQNQQNKLGALHANSLLYKPITNIEEEKVMANKSGRRIIQVFIVDPDCNLPVENAVLYIGEQKFTDASDQELFFELEIQSLLKAHNEKRVKTLDKALSRETGKDVFLEAVKIRDLKMVVSTVAEF